MKLAGFVSLLRGAAACGALLFSGPATAEVLTLDQAYREFLARGVEFGIVAEETAATAERVAQARGNLRPQVSLNAGVTGRYQNVLSSNNPSYTIGEDSYSEGEVSVTLTQPIYDPERNAALSVAKSELVQAQVQALVIQNATTRDLIMAFLGVAQAQAEVRRAQAIERARHEFDAVIQAQIAAGREDATERDRIQADLYSAGAAAAQARQRLAERLAQLQRYVTSDVTGVDARSARIGVVNLSAGSKSFTSSNLTRYSPEVQAALAGLSVQSKRVELAAAARKPKVQLLATLEAQNTQGSLFGGGSNLRMGQAGVSVSVPLYDGGILKSRQREERRRGSAQALRVQQAQDTQLALFKSVVSAQKHLGSQRKALERQLASVNRSVEAENRRLESGRGTEAQLLERQAQRDLVSVELELVALQQLTLRVETFALFGALAPGVLSANGK